MTRCYLAELRLRVDSQADISWIGQSLEAACRRLEGQVLSAVYVRDDCRLACVVKAGSKAAVHRLLEIALLPSARVCEVVQVLGGTNLAGDPARDLDPGVDPEVVEDVGDVRLDGPLGQEQTGGDLLVAEAL